MELTIKEFALLERVTERTVRNWITKGAVVVRRTPGGGVRIADRRDPHTGIPILRIETEERKSTEGQGNSSR